MSTEAVALAKTIIGYSPGVTYKMGDWYAASLANCENVLAGTTAKDTVKRSALAAALSIMEESTFWLSELDDAHTEYEFEDKPSRALTEQHKAYAALEKNHPDLLRAFGELSYEILNSALDVDPKYRFARKRPLESTKAALADVKKNQKVLNLVSITLDKYHTNTKHRESPVDGNVTNVTCAYTIKIGAYTHVYRSNVSF